MGVPVLQRFCLQRVTQLPHMQLGRPPAHVLQPVNRWVADTNSGQYLRASGKVQPLRVCQMISPKRRKNEYVSNVWQSTSRL